MLLLPISMDASRPTDASVLQLLFRHWLAQADDQTVFVRMGIANAFGSVSREQALASAQAHDPLLAQALTPWLCRPSLASLCTDGEQKTMLATGRGIPQGNPPELSTLLHSTGTCTSLRSLNDPPQSPGRIHAYADDGGLAATYQKLEQLSCA